LHTMAANGQIGSSLQALNDQWARDLASDPNRYAYAAKPVHAIRTSVTATCSGWFVTPTGYLVTAAHCVTKDSTISDGLLSAFRTTNKNIPYLQTQAPAYHGNSGGPVLDADGSVVGTLIAGAADPNTGQLVAGEQFVLPATVVDRELAGHGVHPEAGAVTTDYDAALRNYFKGYYTWAVAGFQRVLAAFPDHPYAARYARLARQQIVAGHDRTPTGSFPWLLVLLAAVAAMATGTGVAMWSRGRRVATQAAGAGPAPAPGGPWPRLQAAPPGRRP
jgi:serine protease Do